MIAVCISILTVTLALLALDRSLGMYLQRLKVVTLRCILILIWALNTLKLYISTAGIWRLFGDCCNPFKRLFDNSHGIRPGIDCHPIVYSLVATNFHHGAGADVNNAFGT